MLTVKRIIPNGVVSVIRRAHVHIVHANTQSNGVHGTARYARLQVLCLRAAPSSSQCSTPRGSRSTDTRDPDTPSSTIEYRISRHNMPLARIWPQQPRYVSLGCAHRNCSMQRMAHTPPTEACRQVRGVSALPVAGPSLSFLTVPFAARQPLWRPL